MAFITSVPILQTKNAANVIVVPVNRALRFVGAAVTMDGPGQTLITVGAGTGTWNTAGNVLTGGTPATPTEFMGSTNLYDVPFRRNNVEIMRLISSGLSIGVTGAIGGAPPRIAAEVANGGRLYRYTTTATGAANTSLFMNHSATVGAASASISLATSLADNMNVNEITVIANQTGGGTGALADGAIFKRTVTTTKQGGIVSLLDVQTDYTYAIDPSITVSFSIIVNVLNVTVTGVVGRNLSWSVYNNNKFAG